MALTDFWEIKDNQIAAGQAMLNVYHVTRILAGADAQEVGDAFISTVVNGSLRLLQPTNVTRSTVEVTNLGDPTDFVNIDTTASPGTRAGTALATFAGAGIQFNRTRNDMKNGQKRYYVGVETDIGANNWDPAFIALMGSLANVLLLPYATAAAPGVDVCNLVILKRFCKVPAQDPCLAYRLPNTDAEIDGNFYNPDTAVVRARLRSQVSRKQLI